MAKSGLTTKEKLIKLTRYFNSFGNPLIEWKLPSEKWGGPNQQNCTANIKEITLTPYLQFRIKDDPHWELREKWILSDFKLPIEFKFLGTEAWCLCEKNAFEEYIVTWDETIHYREALLQQKTITKSAVNFMKEAEQILIERGQEYEKEQGEKEERSFASIAVAFNAITGKDLSPAEVALLLQILKDVRQFSQKRFHKDSAVDCINYAALKAELLVEQYGEKDE